ncbi:MAG: Kae1-associated serine/threonine protein kinase [Candidatus Pacearchaeota archaeon]|nr:MAG: Kae1-associated serine/threonine protein kinase [Candidatus Pacearchaeota archaeon]
MKEKIIGRGAEALLIKRGNLLLKRRIKKGYRHGRLDWMLRASRTRREARILRKSASVINVPMVKAIDGMSRRSLEPETEIEMEFIQGKLLSEWLDKVPLINALNVCEKIGQNTALIHDIDIIHGDLTTSNMILKGQNLYFIDFGLGFHSSRVEDRAVDLHLLREALESKHFRKGEDYFRAVIKGYKTSKKASLIIERIKKVEARGRYKGKVKGNELLIP